MPSEQVTRTLKAARRRALVSLGLNMALTGSKAAAAVASGSTALLGDAIHSATDVLASAAAYGGLFLASRQHPSFPYGLYRAETVATLVIGGVILLAAYEIGRQALFGASHPVDVAVALPVALISFAVSLAFGWWQLSWSGRHGSTAIEADGRDYLADALSTAIVIFSLACHRFGWRLDRVAAGLVALFVFRAGAGLVVSTLRELLDVAMDRDMERRLIELVESHPRITRVNQVLSRRAGGRYLVDMDVVMHTPSHKIADHVADRLEEIIPRRFPQILMARVRPHYGGDSLVRRVVPMDAPEGRYVGHLAKAPWFLVETVDRKSGTVVRRQWLENPHRDKTRKRGLLVGTYLLSLKPDEVVLAERKGTAATLLAEAGVDLVLREQEDGAGNGRGETGVQGASTSTSM